MLVIFAVALVALLLFIGLAVDAGAVYVTYGQLKRAVDAAAVAGANDFKKGATVARMTRGAEEVLRLHNVDMSQVDLHVYICDANGDNTRDASLATDVPEFYAACPATESPYDQDPRKLVWVDARQSARLFFLTLLGINTVPLETTAIAEAAAIDVVLVLDVSESMGKDTITPSAYVPDDFNPNDSTTGCNPTDTCQPLKKAKDAAKALVDTLYAGYDRVAIVTFDQIALARTTSGGLYFFSDLTDAKGEIDNITLHDDPNFIRVWEYWRSRNAYNPANVEDRDGNGVDADPGAPCTLDANRWDEARDIPCDADDMLDGFDWNLDGVWQDADDTTTRTMMDTLEAAAPAMVSIVETPLSTCTGCGLLTAANVLKGSARPTSVWVMIVLSDGVANLSDRPGSSLWSPQPVSASYPNGYCPGGMGSYLWTHGCVDNSWWPRYCNDTASTTCPIDPAPPSANQTIWDSAIPSPNMTAIDYARDMADYTALTKSLNLQEPAGNDIAIYAISLGNVGPVGANLLRYMAAVGDDGDRVTDPCSGVADITRSCGQYYYAPVGDALLPIFENIASRIYTRISQ